jgi:hypothetical protein
MEFGQAVSRFLQIPFSPTEFVYIGDIDVLILEAHITVQHVFNMKLNNLPFSNVRRVDDDGNLEDRLSGLHFSEWDSFFPQPKLTEEIYNSWSSEFTLFEIVRRNVGNFEIATYFRPIHGFHLSDKLFLFHNSSTHQIGITETSHVNSYLSMTKSNEWNGIKETFSPIYNSWLDLVDSTISALWQSDDYLESVPTRVSMWNGRFSGPGMNHDVPNLPGISNIRHQFLNTKTNTEANVRSGEIFNLISFCSENEISSVLHESIQTPSWLISINRCFTETIHAPIMGDTDQISIIPKNLGNFSVVTQIPKSLNPDLHIIQPDMRDLTELDIEAAASELNDAVTSSHARFIGLVSSNSFDKRILSSDIGPLFNIEPLFAVKPRLSICLNRRYGGSGKEAVIRFKPGSNNIEIGQYLHVFDRQELLMNPLTNNNETPFPEDLLIAREQEDWLLMFEMFTNNPHNFTSMPKLPQLARMYFMLERYEECQDFTSGVIEENGPTHPDMWLFSARSNVALNRFELVLEHYRNYLSEICHFDVLIEALNKLNGKSESSNLYSLVEDYVELHDSDEEEIKLAYDVIAK